MAKNNKNHSNPSGMLLLAKRSGITSFSSLFSVKHALNTEKVGHTGTLDSFADGLLVVLTGGLTHLVPHITSFKKKYLAVICFGKETDTFDPCGAFTKKGKAVTRSQLESVIGEFSGALLQTPPLYSAVHVDGMRASDLMRQGKEVKIEARQIFVYENKILDFREASQEDSSSYALLEITCSKGTYIRALARDIALRLGTCAHLCALRRSAIGPFSLEDAALSEDLEDFTIDFALKNEEKMIALNEKILRDQKENAGKGKAKKILSDEEKEKSENENIKIRSHFMPFTKDLAFKCGFEADEIKAEDENAFLNGRPLSPSMFDRISLKNPLKNPAEKNEYNFDKEFAVFYKDGTFAGMVKKEKHHLAYSFVVPKKDFKILKISWANLLKGDFPLEWKKRGTAVSVGSFDGFHSGHKAICQKLVSKKELIPGLVTFSSSARAVNNFYEGDILSLYQKINLFQEEGFKFVIVIDFSDDFSKINGADFMSLLLDKINVKYLAEGQDFKCGYKAAFTMKELEVFAKDKSFIVEKIPDVLYEGQRISSSRIRLLLKDGSFLPASKMMTRPFSYDLGKSYFEKEASQENADAWYAFEANGFQLLPKDGNYKVTALLSQKGSCDLSLFQTLACLKKEESENHAGKIKVLLPDEEMASRLKAITFV